MFSNRVGTGINGEDEAGEEQSAAQCVPHDPHPGPICRTYGQQEFSVYKFVPPPTTTPPHSSKLFALKILTKELSQMPLSPPRMSARVRKLLLQAKECVCALNENISFVSFFDQRKERFEGHIYNTRGHKPLKSKSFQPSKTNPPEVKWRTKHRKWKIIDLLVGCSLALWLIYKSLV